MSLVAMGVGAVAGLLAVVVSQLFVSKEERKARPVHALIFATFMGLGSVASREYFEPKFAAASVDSELAKMPIYQALQQHEPAVYAQIVQALRLGIENQTPNEVTFAQTRPLISGVIERRTKTASNDALRQLASVVIDEVVKLHARGDDTCFQLLFPQPGQSIDVGALVGKDIGVAELAAQTAIIRSSATAPQPMPTEAEVGPTLLVVVAPLQTKFSAVDLALLGNPGAPGTNKRRVCEMTIDLYGEVLKLPTLEGGKLLRYMMGGA